MKIGPCGVLCLLVASGCATTPRVTTTYYFPKAHSEIVVTQTIGCAVSNKVLSSANASVTNTYVADYGAPHTIAYKTFDGFWRDADTGVTLVDDGRLSGVNSVGTGEASGVLKNAVAFAGVFTGVSAAGAAAGGGAKLTGQALQNYILIFGEPPTDPGKDEFCDIVREYAGYKQGDKVNSVTLTYRAKVDYIVDEHEAVSVAVGPATYLLHKDGAAYLVGQDGTPATNPSAILIPPDPASQALYAKLQRSKRKWTFDLLAHSSKDAPAQPAYKRKKGDLKPPTIAVPLLSGLMVSVDGPPSTLDPVNGKIPTMALWRDTLVVPTRASAEVPITRAPLVGGAKTLLGLAGSGLVNKLEYGKTSGAGDLSGFAPAIAMQAEGRTDAQLASAVQAKADLIYQQQRLVTCQLDPKTGCTSK